MKRWINLLLGLLPVMVIVACHIKQPPAATPAGFVNPEASLIPTQALPSPTSTLAPPQTETPFPGTTPQLPVSLITQPLTDTPTKLPACHETAGSIQDRQIDSDLLDDPLTYIIYLPPCYAEQSDRHYPVLYLFHGQTYTNRHWLDLGAASIADRLITEGEIAPFIMVLPYDRNHYDPPTRNAFGEAVLFDLIPAVDLTFRTIPTRAARAIGGISRGGNWAAHLGLQHPGLFSAVGLHSTPIFSTDTNQEIIDWIKAIPIDEFPRLFIDSGENDRWLEYTLVFEALLNANNIPHQWHLYPGFHEDDYWESHLDQYIRWYAQDW